MALSSIAAPLGTVGADRLGSIHSFNAQIIPRSELSYKFVATRKSLIVASVSERIPQSTSPKPASVNEIPGTHGFPLIGAIKDRLDYFQGRDEFFRKRMEKYQSTVYRVNMPPGPPFFPDPRVIMLLDAKSFPVLFDTTKVEKKNLFTGAYMPSTEFTGGYRTLSYLDPSEEKHTQLKNFCFEVLMMNRDRWIPEFNKATSELWEVLEKQLADTGKAVFNDANEQMAFNFLARSVTDRDPALPGPISLGNEGPTLIKKWVFFQLAPLTSIGLPKPLEELTFHTVPLPFGLIRKDYEKLHTFFSSYATRALTAADKFGIGKDEACHNLLFNICFNTFGGMMILFPCIVRLIARAGAHLHKDLAEEVRAAVKAHGGLTMRALESMALVRSTVYEVMRIEPPVPFQYGRAKEDFNLESHERSYAVKKGELLGGFQPFATRDPKVFENPEEFMPRRFMGDDGQKLLKYVYWSNGPETENPTVSNKQCAGKDFVVMIARLLVAELFLQYDSFDIEFSPSSVTFTSLKKATF